MSGATDTTLSSLGESAESTPLSLTNIIIAVIIFTLMMAHIICRTSPMHLTCNLVAAIDEAEKAYIRAIEAGVFSAFDANMELKLSR
jgi:hypothetical protein